MKTYTLDNLDMGRGPTKMSSEEWIEWKRSKTNKVLAGTFTNTLYQLLEKITPGKDFTLGRGKSRRRGDFRMVLGELEFFSYIRKNGLFKLTKEGGTIFRSLHRMSLGSMRDMGLQFMKKPNITAAEMDI